MYVYSKNSRIFHNELCGCAKRISPQNRRFTGAANPASELGLMHCKFCAPIVRQMKKEKEELLPYPNRCATSGCRKAPLRWWASEVDIPIIK